MPLTRNSGRKGNTFPAFCQIFATRIHGKGGFFVILHRHAKHFYSYTYL